ncbi:MAG: transglutaminase domain-containing protein, partial [Oscillibacter sp.]|nr:transglutaminase domain-containing protein [Oscillibacter sp.]
LTAALLTGCAQTPAETPENGEESPVYTNQIVLAEIELEDEAVPLAGSPAAQSTLLLPVASGTAVQKTDKAVIDYSNSKDGYVMAQFTATTNKRLKVQVKGPTTTYTYDLPAGTWATFPLSDGNGSYKVDVLENTTGKKYAYVVSASFQVTLSDEFAPFLRPNQYVDYGVAPNSVKKAAELAGSITNPLEKVAKIYDFVVETLTYDKQKAATVQSGYLPVLDTVLSTKKGICFDYASLMVGMLRSQGVPCKLVVGYAGTAYHAWVNVWTKETGWVDGVIFFDGTTWQRMDPTFASSGKSSESIMQYIGDGSNYTVKYLY